MANPTNYTGQASLAARPGVELKWPASVLWRPGEPAIRQISVKDVYDSLAEGIEDFRATPTHVLFAILIYPVIGLLLYRLLTGYNMLPLVYPMLAGFTLIGPVAAIGLYELSRRREQGLKSSVAHFFDVFKSPSIGTITRLGLVLAAIFFFWVYCAQLLYSQLFGALAPATVSEFVDQVTTTQQGWNLFLAGNVIGFLFAAAVLVISVVSFPMLVDRNVSASTAVRASVRAAIENPGPVALWGLLVALALLFGALPLLIGLAVVVPILGHATWHLYRKLVGPDQITG